MTQRTLPSLGLIVAIAFGGCVAVPVPGSVEACAFEERAVIPITMQGNVPLVPVRIDGSPATMVLDTGAEWSRLSEQAGHRLSLPTDWGRSNVSEGIGGSVVREPLTADRIELGALRLRNQSIDVGLVNWSQDSPRPDGYLGANILSRFDVDIDLPHGRVTLYRPRDCPQGGPPWTAPYRTAAIHRPSPEHNLVATTVLLDGTALLATIDTGAEGTYVDRRAAVDKLGIDPATLDRDRGGAMFGSGPNLVPSRLHSFRSESVAGERVSGPRLLVLDLPPFAGDMLLGADYLRVHRIYLSYVTGRVFIGDADTLAAGAAAP